MENTELLEYTEENIKYAAKLIKSGKVVGIPTETVYGLGADAMNPEAVKAIFAAKGRPADNPLIVHISSIETVKELAHDVPELFYTLAEKFWPGPLTMIVPKNSTVPDVTSGGLDTLAIRMPSNPVMKKLIEMCGPIAAPSANISGYPSPTNAFHVLRDMKGKIPAVIDDGSSNFGVESTVICFENENNVRILRPGSITPEMFEKEGVNAIVDEAVMNGVKEGEKVKSPGMKYKHYSPEADLIIVEGTADKFIDFVRENCNETDFCYIPRFMDANELPCNHMYYENDIIDMAYCFYDDLRELDEKGAKTVYVFPPDKSGVGLAVYNRLLRAAGFEVVYL